MDFCVNNDTPKTICNFISKFLNEIKEYDYTSYQHSVRVGKIATILYKYYQKQYPHNCNGLKLWEIEAAGLLHDAGKLFVPIEILNFPGQLSLDERLVIEKHPKDGYDYCKSSITIIPILDGILEHHERLNGHGYPNHLTKISLTARIIAVADVLDALRSSRPYKESWPWEKIIHYFINNQKSFDSDLCKLLQKQKIIKELEENVYITS